MVSTVTQDFLVSNVWIFLSELQMPGWYRVAELQESSRDGNGYSWVAVKELKLSYHNGYI